jgi:hypothetical protein
MKNLFKISLAFVLIFSTILACKKDSDDIKLEQPEQQFSMAVKMASKSGRSESGIVVGTKATLDKAFSSGNEKVLLKKISEKNNLFAPTTGTTGPVDPIDPSALCWDEINAYVAAHKDGWLATANQTCQPVYACVTCPNAGGGLYVMYVIKPTSFKCATLEEASTHYVKFNFTSNDYNGEAVAAHINANSK